MTVDGSAHPGVLGSLSAPIVQAPMAGGPSTPALAAAVGRAGGLGFVAAGYLTPDRLRADIAATRSEVTRFGVNVFARGSGPADPEVVARYGARLQAEADRLDVALGTPSFDDDFLDEKVEVLLSDPVAVVSFTFGLPAPDVVPAFQELGTEVWMTVTSPEEARLAVASGADALVVQGIEAGGHRGVFVDDDGQSDLTLLAALQLVRAETDLPLVAAGSIMTGRAVAAVLVAGASAAQVGTAFLLAPEAGTSAAQRAATTAATPTVLTRAFSGRLARGIANRFHGEFGDGAPHAYPEVHHLTSPLRARGRSVGDPDTINLWAGQAHVLVEALPAEAITRQLAREARAVLRSEAERLGP